MTITRTDLAELAVFAAVARHQSFSKAALELGVSASALSHSLKGWRTGWGAAAQPQHPGRGGHRCGPAAAGPVAAHP